MPFASIAYRKLQPVLFGLERYLCYGAAGVAQYARQSLLHDAEDCNLDFVAVSTKLRAYLQRYVDAAALFEALRQPWNGHRKSTFTQQGRMQQIGDAANPCRTLIGNLFRLPYQSL